MNPTAFLYALRARRRLFLVVLAATVVAAVLASLIAPKTYVARAALIVDGKYEQSISTNPVLTERERAGYLQTQVDILASPRVARRVVDDLQLGADRKLIRDFEKSGDTGQIEDWIAGQLLKALKVDLSQSSIIRFSVGADDPALAARLANGFGKAYVDSVLELRVEPLKQTSSWFDDQLTGLRENMEQAERRLAEFQQENGILTSDERYDVDNIQLTELATRVARMRPPPSAPGHGAAADEGLPLPPDRGIETLKASLIAAETRLEESSSTLGARHPTVVRQQAEVAALRDKLDSETQRVEQDVRRVAQAERQSKTRLLAEMAAQRQRVADLRQARNQLAVLTNDFTIAQRTYDAAMQRAAASRIDSRASMANVGVLSDAVAPTRPDRPNLPLNLALALFIGTLLGLAAVYAQEISDRRLRLIDDIGTDSDIPLLAVLGAGEKSAVLRLVAPGRLPSLPGPA